MRFSSIGCVLCACFLIFNTKRKEAPSPDHVDPMTALLSYLPKCENPAFFLCRNALPFHMGNQTGPYTEKPPQAVSSPILNPNSRTFWNDWKDSADRTAPPPGNSACRDGHSSCRVCYIKEMRSFCTRMSYSMFSKISSR